MPVKQVGGSVAPRNAGMNSAGANTIGRDLFIKGEISGVEELVIEGRVEGSIRIKSHLHVTESAVLVADIQAETVVIDGEVRGNIVAAGRVEVSPSARVIGDIQATSVRVADGARFKGAIDMEVPVPRELV